jgi:hypothetical protein
MLLQPAATTSPVRRTPPRQCTKAINLFAGFARVLIFPLFVSEKFMSDNPIGIRVWSGGGCIEHNSLLSSRQ